MREFMQTGHIDFFVESITIASACNKVLRKRFLYSIGYASFRREGIRVITGTARRP